MKLTFQRNYPLLLLTALALAGLALGLGSTRITAYTTPGTRAAEAAAAAEAGGTDIANRVDVFDDSLVHSIQLVMDADLYDQMITTYQETGEKDYFAADVIIDGVRVSDVGVRLKGNASLRTALGGMGGGRGNFFNPADGQGEQLAPQRAERLNRGDFALPEGMQPPEGMQLPDEAQPPEGVQRPEGGQFAGGGLAPGGGGMSNQQIPLLIKFDEFISGQTYQGRDRLAVRSSGISYDAAMLQEPLTNYVMTLAGLPAPRTAYAGFSLNGAPEELYTISEVIEEDYLEEHFANPGGVLYKSELNATMSYQGEDPSLYAGSFTQETRENEADLAALIDFLQFVSESDDETFASQLPARLDVESFAAYLAVNSLLVNNDSMAGMGNNFYLYYDDQSGQMTVLYWDGNESLGKLAGMGGQGGQGAGAAESDPLVLSAGSAGGRAGAGGMMRGASNPLLTRFLANAEFNALYRQKVAEITEAAFGSGAAVQQAETYTALVRAAYGQRSLVDAQAFEQAAADTIDFLTLRGDYLLSLVTNFEE